MKKVVIFLLLIILNLSIQPTSFAEAAFSNSVKIKKLLPDNIRSQKINYVPGEILVKYRKSKINLNSFAGQRATLNFNKLKSLEKKEDFKNSNISVLKIKDGKTVEQKIAELKNNPDIEYAEPNYKRYSEEIDTNDTNKALLWGLDNVGQTVNSVSGTSDADIDAPEAWAINEGTSSSIIVAIIDTGVAYNHPDLIANMWNGDDCLDENGDDLGGCNHGYDFEDDDKTPLPTTNNHGTHVAGTIAAVKNNEEGIIGVAPNAKIMALKFGLDTASEVRAIDFAIQNNAKIINASYGGDEFSQAEYDAIDRFRQAGGIFVAAAGNDHTNNESVHKYPSDYVLDNIISVAATDQNDNLASFSNYGISSVDVGAPGVNIYSTIPESTSTEVLNENFEELDIPNIPDGWATSSNGYWGTKDVSGFWDSHVNALIGDINTPYADNATSTITALSYDLQDVSSAHFDFWTACDTEYNPVFFMDYMILEISSDGISFTPLEVWDEYEIDSDSSSSSYAFYHFENLTIPDGYLSADFKFRLRWVTSPTDNNYGGCAVDDFKIIKNYFDDGASNQYQFKNGTSMATPHVVGLAALIEGYNPNLLYSQVKNIILTTGDDLASLSGKTVSGKRINAQTALQTVDSAKEISSFDFVGISASSTIDEDVQTILVSVPFGTDVATLTPEIVITGVSVSPASGLSQDFSDPVLYTVTAAGSSTQAYTVTVTVDEDPDIASVAADKDFLTEDSIKGENSDLSNITVSLNILPALGENSSTIIWTSDNSGIISNDGQTINRPLFSSGNATVTMTAFLTKGVVSSTKEFLLTVIKLPAPPVVSYSSGGGGSYIPPAKVVIATTTQEEATTTTEVPEERVLEPELISRILYSSLFGLESGVVNEVSKDEAEIIDNWEDRVAFTGINEEIYKKVTAGYGADLNEKIKINIAYFIQIGTPTTNKLGAGERAGSLNSYFTAFGAVPSSVSDWQDVIKIANGRWPSQKIQVAEDNAIIKFKKIYLRTPDMNNPNDNAAVTVMAYGLRPANRNMNSEKTAIKSFKAIFKYNPYSAIDWDAVRAIAYSGAKR
ncbi:MAG: S8 family serine peptidase [Patescibacteria group bacterium]